MRDKNRISIVLQQVAEIWEQHPDLRFMQMIDILQSKNGDMFYVEDDQFVNLLKIAMENVN